MVELSTLGSVIRTASGMFVTPMDYGATGDGTTDDTTAVQASFDSGNPVFLDRYYAVTSVHFPDFSGFILMGGGSYSCGLVGLSTSSDYILATFNPAEADQWQNCHMSNFGVIGDGQVAVAIVQIINSSFNDIHLVSGDNTRSPNAFRGVTGFLFEECFSNVVRNLQASGPLTGTSFRINTTVIDTIFDMLYSANSNEDFNIDVDSTRREISTITASGYGQLIFNCPTCQGAQKYGMKLVAQGEVLVNMPYFENCAANIFSATEQLTVTGCGMYHVDTNPMVWIDRTNGVTPARTTFQGITLGGSAPIVVGDAGEVNFVGCRDVSGASIYTRIQRASTNYVWFPFSGANTVISVSPSSYDVGTGAKQATMIGLTTDGTNGLFTEISVDEAGTISAKTPFALTDTTFEPDCVFVNYFGTTTPAWTSGVAITPITCRGIGGTSPYTYSFTGSLPAGLSVDASTGELSGTPTETGSFSFRIEITDTPGEVATSRQCVATVS